MLKLKSVSIFITIFGRLLLVNIGEKKIIFLEREKNNFNSMLKLKSVSIFITIFSQYFHNKS